MERLIKRNKIKKVVYIFFIILLILLLLSWLYVFNIYEVGIGINRISSLDYVVSIQPKNSFGKEAFFRKVEYSYKVTEGNENVKNIKDDEEGNLLVKLKSESVKVKLQIKTNKTQNISIVEIP